MMKTSIWWDLENNCVPADCPPKEVRERMQEKLAREGYAGDVEIRVFVGRDERVPRRHLKGLRKDIYYEVVDSDAKDAADKAIQDDIKIWLAKQVKPQTVVLITGDKGFIEIMQLLRLHQHAVLVVYIPGSTAISKMRPHATAVWKLRQFLLLGKKVNEELANKLASQKTQKPRRRKCAKKRRNMREREAAERLREEEERQREEEERLREEEERLREEKKLKKKDRECRKKEKRDKKKAKKEV